VTLTELPAVAASQKERRRREGWISGVRPLKKTASFDLSVISDLNLLQFWFDASHEEPQNAAFARIEISISPKNRSGFFEICE
jgi:hypothetical protein